MEVGFIYIRISCVVFLCDFHGSRDCFIAAGDVAPQPPSLPPWQQQQQPPAPRDVFGQPPPMQPWQQHQPQQSAPPPWQPTQGSVAQNRPFTVYDLMGVKEGTIWRKTFKKMHFLCFRVNF